MKTQRTPRNETICEYGVRVYTAANRADLYVEARGTVDETMLRRIAIGIQRKRELLEAMRMVPRHRSLVVIPKD